MTQKKICSSTGLTKQTVNSVVCPSGLVPEAACGQAGNGFVNENNICLIPVLLWLYLVERNYGWTALVLLFYWHGKAATFMLYAMLIVHLAWCDIPI